MARWGWSVGAWALLASTAHAGETPLYQPAPDWVKPAPAITPAQLAPAAPLFVLFDNQQRLQDGQVWGYVDRATRMASAEVLAQSGTLTIPWQPSNGDLIVHRVEIVRGTDHIDLLAGGKRFTVIRREQQLEQREVNGVLTATMPVEGLRIGDLLRVAVSITNRDSALKGQVQTSAPLPVTPFRIGYARTRFVWPVADPVQWKTYAEGAKPVVTTTGGYRDLTVEGILPKQPDIPTDAPVRFARPTIVEATSFAGWSAVSKTMAALYTTAGLIPAGSPLAGEVARIKAASADPVTRAAQALELVQEKIRYLFNGMDGGNYRPQAPAETWTLRYGDCKAKTLLLLALLHELNIDAEAAVAPAQAGDLIAGRLPMPGAFDHVMVKAMIGGETLWLDGTAGGTRLVDIHDVPPFRTVLPLRDAGADLLPVPFRPDTRADGEVTLDLDQRAGVTLPTLMSVSMKFRGQAASMIGLAAEQVTADQRREMVQGLVTKLVGDTRLADEKIAYDAATGFATVTATGMLTTPWRQERERRRFTLDRVVGQIEFTPDRIRPAWRAMPVIVGARERLVIHTRLHLPQDGQGFALGGDQTLGETIAGRAIKRNTTLAAGLVTVDEESATVVPEIAAPDVAATRARLALADTRLLEVVAPANLPSAYASAVAARRSGTLKPILTAYAKAIENDPGDKDVYLNRARFFDGIYDRAAAIPDLGKALEIEPEVSTYLWRANLYDQTGDPVKQVADLKQAAELDPANSDVVGAMAGYRIDHGEQAQALAMVQEHVDAGGKDAGSYLAMKADLLAKAGRKDEALAAIDAALADDPASAALLNSRCWIKGTLGVQLDTALKDCSRSIELSSGSTAVIDSRAMVYFRLNRLDEAMTDLGTALATSPDQAASLYLRGIIRARQGKLAESKVDVATARAIWPQVDREYARWGIKP
ncbi:hypothetical protein ASG67_03410 [Sphingomonas sp. Leaf339]|uniref:DUF3857 domain-containing protein n=1 Tax=Sphingomonas sp. Leaf339 TaxID=1736343 RepID=UPI0006F4F5E9|nr:DUF3857 domain-containing protein [Sphingomonas sp. Leaf339]KQU62182.1 hypothetical protein ASG67_03410 [Sphingomonas sp. Leaf339]